MKKLRTLILYPLLLMAALVMVACGGEEVVDEAAATAESVAEEVAGEAEAVVDEAEEAVEEAVTEVEEAVADAEPVTLRVLVHQNPPMVEYMEMFNEQFEAAYPNVTVDMSVVNAGELGTVNQTRLTANDVDVMVISLSGFSNAAQPYMSNVTPPAWQTLIEAGLLLDLTDEEWITNYDAATLADGGSFNDRIYGIPTGRVTYSGMFVNTTLLDEVGVAIPTTWEELVAACETIKAADYNCMTAGGGDGWPIFVGSYGLLGAFYPDQAGLVEGLWTGDIKWNDETTLELWNRYQIYATEMLEPGVTGLAHDAAIARYAAGDVAFAPTGNWQAPALEDAGPAFEWTYIPFPGSSNAAENQFLYGKYDQTWAIAADSPNTEVALAYMEMFSEPDNYQAFIDAVGFIPTQPTATLNSQLGLAVAPIVENFQVGFEQYWVSPTGAGQWANGSLGSSWFAPFNEWEDAEALANQAQEDLQAGLDAQ